ncbi:MAG TPA: UvrD-helicase domain-containing protein [Vicinamibacterales bacterium]
MIDRIARDAIANDLDSTLIVEAAAGTGKTTELVNRILRILAAGKTTIGKIVAVTFTEKAAGELKLRLREALERERMPAGGDARARLDEALTKLEEAHVSTIHGFCADLLRERPVEARVDPLFTVLTEAQAERLFAEAFGGWLQEQLANPREGLRRALRRSAGWPFGRRPQGQDGPIDRLRQAAWDLSEWRDFPEPWTRRPFSRSAAIEDLVRDVHAFAAMTESPSYARDNLFLDTAGVRHLSQEIRTQRSIGVLDEDGWEARLVDLSRQRSLTNARHGRGPGYRQGVSRAAVVAALDDLRARLDQFRMDADADLAALLQDELADAIARYEQLKRRSGALDFLDLLLKARGLMTSSADLRREFQERFTHVFVDEFQDTDPLQAEILLLLTSDDTGNADWRTAVPAPGRLFIVGDPKQSIYRFRRADVGVFRDVCERLERAGATRVELTASFRSVPEIQACVNAAFEPIMTGDALTLQASYVPLSPYRSALAGQPAVVALPVPEPYGQRNISMIAIERSFPDAVGAFIEWVLTKSKWEISERRGLAPAKVEARHICILFRRFLSFGQDMTQPYVRALEARGVPHVLVGGKTFHDREEVDTLRAALSAVEWPDDELSVFATLRGALFAIGDEELLEWRHGLGLPFHPFHWRPGLKDQPADSLRGSPIVAALELLRELHRRRNYVPIAETIQRLIDSTRAHVGFVLRGGGEQALANVLHVAELARQYEMDGGISFRGFVDELRAAAEGAQAPEAPILEEGSDGVRLMTVHKAKGLEFPIVILADPTCKMSRVDASRWLDPERPLCALKIAGLSPLDLLFHGAEELAREHAEGARLAYVAATRARDVLVVPVIGDGSYEGGWLDPLMPAVYPPESSRRDASRAPGCPAVTSKDSVLNRPDGDPARSTTVAPGLHRFASPASRTSSSGAYSVTWWDPRTLALGAESSFGLTRDDLIVKDGDMFAVEERLADYERWKAHRAAAIAGASRPTLRVATATAWAHDRQSEEGFEHEDTVVSAIETVAVARAGDRPAGVRFGTLVHATLATVPLDADAAAIARVAATQARILGASEDEREAAAQAVGEVLAHPLLLRARRCAESGGCHREVPVTWIAPDGLLVEGTIDLAFEEGEELVVLDFKTDRELTTDFDQYRRQVDVYCRAIAAVKNKPARGILLRV